jgi:hypothetical protein
MGHVYVHVKYVYIFTMSKSNNGNIEIDVNGIRDGDKHVFVVTPPLDPDVRRMRDASLINEMFEYQKERPGSSVVFFVKHLNERIDILEAINKHIAEHMPRDLMQASDEIFSMFTQTVGIISKIYVYPVNSKTLRGVNGNVVVLIDHFDSPESLVHYLLIPGVMVDETKFVIFSESTKVTQSTTRRFKVVNIDNKDKDKWNATDCIAVAYMEDAKLLK